MQSSLPSELLELSNQLVKRKLVMDAIMFATISLQEGKLAEAHELLEAIYDRLLQDEALTEKFEQPWTH